MRTSASTSVPHAVNGSYAAAGQLPITLLLTAVHPPGIAAGACGCAHQAMHLAHTTQHKLSVITNTNTHTYLIGQKLQPQMPSRYHLQDALAVSRANPRASSHLLVTACPLLPALLPCCSSNMMGSKQRNMQPSCCQSLPCVSKVIYLSLPVQLPRVL